MTKIIAPMNKNFALLVLILLPTINALATIPPDNRNISYNDTLQFLSKPGPRNYSADGYAYLYIYRPNKSVGANTYYELNHEKEWLVPVGNNTRIIQKIPVRGSFNVWGEGNGITSLDMNLQHGHSYFIRFDITESQPANTLRFTQIDSVEGIKEYNQIKGKEYVFDYPMPAPLVSNFPKKEYRAYFVRNLSDSMTFGPVTFLPPVSTRFYYILPNEGFQFVYKNKLLSSTYSEIDKISVAASKKLNSQDELLDFIKKHIRNGKDLVEGKNKLIKMEYEPLEAGNSDLAYAVTNDIEDLDTPLKGDAPFLLLREYTIYIYKKTDSKNGIMSVIRFTERGLPEEVHTSEEMRYKAKLLMNSIVYH